MSLLLGSSAGYADGSQDVSACAPPAAPISMPNSSQPCATTVSSVTLVAVFAVRSGSHATSGIDAAAETAATV